MMTKPQQYIMRLLSDYRCLRIKHIERLVKTQYKFNAWKTAIILSQLRYIGKIRLTEDGLAALPYAGPREAVLTTFDVMIDLCGGRCLDISYRDSPFTLFFTTDSAGEEKRFAIISEGTESQIKRNVKLLGNKNMSIILIIGEMSRIGNIEGLHHCYFAIGDGNGGYKYYRQ